jgi:CheY-like chemotaxis protein
MKKLVVGIFEDNEINRFIWTSLLETKTEYLEGHIFETIEQGISVAQNTAFDVVIIETHFWGQSFYGLHILARLKEVCKTPFIPIATTALLQVGDWERILNGGFTACMEKPLSVQHIEDLLALRLN